MDFPITVHGEFETARQVLVYLSTILNSSTYKGLLTSIFILIVTLMVINGTFESLFGNLRNSGSWLKAFFAGIFIYGVFLSGSARIILYDDISGNSHVQDNIPPGVALMIWFPNRIATGIEEMVAGYLAPGLPLSPFAYEVGVGMTKDLYTGKMATALSTIIPPEVWRSADNYMKDCVALLAAREGAYAAKLYSGTNPYQEWAQAQNNFFYTYSSLDSSGNPLPDGTPDANVSCTDAWNRLNAFFGSTTWQDVVDFYCKLERLGDNANSLAACRNILEDTVSRYILGGYTMTAENISKNVFAGKVFYNFLATLDSSVAIGRVAAAARAQAELSGRGAVLQEWIPIMKTIFFLLACALIPLVLLFIATGTGSIKYILGIFVWWMLWCGIDTVIYCLWVSRADQLYEAIEAGSRLGLSGLESLWLLSSKALGLLGAMRGMGFLLAGTMCYTLFRFGGSALAHMAASLGGMVSGSVPKMTGYISPEQEGYVQHYQALAKYNQRLAEYQAYHTPDYFRRVAEARAMKSMGDVRATQSLAEKLGGSPSSPAVIDRYSDALAGNMLKNVASGLAAGGFSLNQWLAQYRTSAAEGIAKGQELQQSLENIKKEFGLGSDLEAARYALANPEVSGRIGKNLGLLKEYAALQKAGVIGPDMSLQDYVAEREAIRGMLGGADVFAFARKAGEQGLSPAQAAYAKSLFSWGREMSHLNELMKRFEGKDLSQLTPEEIGELGNTLGRIYGAFEHARTTAGGLGEDAAIFTEYQKGLNEATKFFANAAAGWWLNTGILPSSVKQALDTIASTPEGKRLLQKHLSNLEVSGLTEGQAKRINETLAAKGLDTRFRPGDAAALHLAYTGDQENPFEIASARAASGAERTARDTTSFSRGISAKNWNGFFMLGKDGYSIHGAESFNYDPHTGRFLIKGAQVRDAAGNLYSATLEGKGRAIKDSAGNIVGMEVKNLRDLAVEDFRSVHGVRMPGFDLSPEKALNLAHHPEKLAATLEKFKDNPLVRQAFITEFSNKLAQGIAAYADLSHKEDVSKGEKSMIIRQASLSASGQTGPSVVTKGKVMPAELAKLAKSLGFGGKVSLGWQNQIVSGKSETATSSFKVAAAAVRKTLEDGYAFAEKYGNDAPIENAAFRIYNAVSSIEESAEKAIDKHIRMEKDAGKTDITGTTPTEYMSGEKIKLERMGETIDVRGINPKKQIPWKTVSAKDLNEE